MAKKGGRLNSKEGEELPKAKFTAQNLKKTFRLFTYVKPHKGKFFLGMLFLAGTASVALVFPALAGKVLGIYGETKKNSRSA